MQDSSSPARAAWGCEGARPGNKRLNVLERRVRPTSRLSGAHMRDERNTCRYRAHTPQPGGFEPPASVDQENGCCAGCSRRKPGHDCYERRVVAWKYELQDCDDASCDQGYAQWIESFALGFALRVGLIPAKRTFAAPDAGSAGETFAQTSPIISAAICSAPSCDS